MDAAGCEVQRAIPRAGRNFQPAEAEQTSLSICRYDVGVPGANLAQSERLSVIDSVKARKAVEAAPAIVAPTACLDVPGEQVVLIASDQGDLAWVHLGQCQGLDDDRTHLLTGDVLFWVLSPGWSGPVDDLPLPDRLRRPAPR